MPTTRLRIEGMTCRSCEVRVTRRLQALDGVSRVRVSARSGTAEVTSRRPVPAQALAAAVRKAGYSVVTGSRRPPRPWVSRDPGVWQDVAVAVAVCALLVAAYRAGGTPALAWLQGLAGGDGASAAAATGVGGLLVVLTLGLAAGFSTCMALVGGLVMAVSAGYANAHPGQPARQRLRPHLAFNAGRVLGFTTLGAGLGALGSVFALDGVPLALAMIAVALVMGAIGLRLTQVSPRLSDGPGFALPSRLALALRLDGGAGAPSSAPGAAGALRTAGLGAATFLLPCGFTQAVQVLAISTGSPWRAAAVMGLFALGTTPGLLVIGGVASGLSAAPSSGVTGRASRYAGVAVLGFAAVNAVAAAGILLPGLGLPGSTGTPTAITANVQVVGGTQVLSTTQDLDGYSPAEATVYAGMPVSWRIESTSMGCASLLDARSLGLDRVMLDFGMNELQLAPREPGTYRYSCAMGMFHGVINVIPRPAA